MRRRIYTGLGLTFVGIGMVGIVVPGLPTTIFLILALYFFRKGSSRFEDWLLNHPRFGGVLRDWERDRCIRPAVKRRATTVLWLCLAATWAFLAYRGVGVWGQAAIPVTGGLLTWYILSRRSHPKVEVAAPAQVTMSSGVVSRPTASASRR